jgi:hypothetical protein
MTVLFGSGLGQIRRRFDLLYPYFHTENLIDELSAARVDSEYSRFL